MSSNIEVGEKTGRVFLNNDEIEGETLKQIKAMIKEDAIENARIMPDCHKSKNCCVGFTSKLVNKIVPNYVGNDIGCGIVSYPIELKKSVESFRQKQLEKIISDIDTNIAFPSHNRSALSLDMVFESFKVPVNRIFDLANSDAQKFKTYYQGKFKTDITGKIPIYNQEWLEGFLTRTKLSNQEFYGSLMTLGSGNHFIEFNRSTNTKKEYVTVHSGSRIVGKKICEHHQNKIYTSSNDAIWLEFDKKGELFNKSNKNKKDRLDYRNQLRSEMKEMTQTKKKFLEEGEAIDYYIDMIFGQKYAIVNREMMINYVLNKLSNELVFDPSKKIESIHNYIDFEDFIMRKGAISSKKDEICLIALNMAEGVLLCKGKGNEDWNYSCAHGAGRQMTREKAIKSRIPIEKRLIKILEKNGVYSSAQSQIKLLVDEAPECYKESGLIVERIQPTVEIIDHLKPFINIKSCKIEK
jgi:tRNA-splicing ligase RtcB (3'-phosphate/5'-hydroxy nucleic acid ligase)